MFGFISSCIKPVSHIESYLVGRVFTVPTDADSNPETKITTAWVCSRSHLSLSGL